MVEQRILGAGLVLVSAAALGFFMKNDLRQRILLLEELSGALRVLGQEIEYRKAPLEEAFVHAGSSIREPWAAIFLAVGEELEQLPEASFLRVWDEKMQKALSGLPLKSDDRELLGQIGAYLGHLESGENRGMMTFFERRLETAAEEAREEYRSKAKLYGKLGIVGGIFMVILLI